MKPQDTNTGSWPTHIDSNKQDDMFLLRDGKEFAGTHLLLDCWQASDLSNIEHIETALREAVAVCGATLLHIHLHHFTPNGGVSGVAVLAESHISIHTWPERDYAAIDIFMCGETQPKKSIAVFENAFTTGNIVVTELKRGLIEATKVWRC